jgi:hypothetical protein
VSARPWRQGPASGTGDRLAARAVLLLYPRAWRDRYGEEIRALLADTGCSVASIASLAWQALPAWVCPPRHLHDREARVRASLGTVLAAWSALTGIGIVFAQLTQLQGFGTHQNPLVPWSYRVFDAGLGLSVLAAAACGLPLWLQMLRQAHRERRSAETAWLSLAIAAPAAFIAVAGVALRIVHHPEGTGSRWFLGFAVLGFAMASLAAAGPIVALHRLRPRGPAVHLAAAGAAVAAVAVSVAAAASGLAATGLCLWTRNFAGYRHDELLGGYLILITVVAATATISAARGIRARFAAPPA